MHLRKMANDSMSLPCGSEAGQNRDGNGAAITPERTTGSRARVPESIDWKMRFAAKLTAGHAEARIVLCADNRTVSAARADQLAQPMPCEFPTREPWRAPVR